MKYSFEVEVCTCWKGCLELVGFKQSIEDAEVESLVSN